MRMLDVTDGERIIRSARLFERPVRGSWYDIKARTDDEVSDVYIYDEIGPWWGVTAKDFVSDLREIRTPKITLHLHSNGGEVFDGIAIYRALKDHPSKVEVRVDSLAASIASVIAMAGDHIVMAKHSEMMIHDPLGLTFGNARDHEEQIALLNRFGDKIAGIYQERAGGSKKAWRDRMLETTWYSDQEAVDMGLADAIGEPATRAKNQFDLSMYGRPADPNDSPEPTRTPTIRDAEAALREVGLSQEAAKAILARGWGARDVPPPAPDLWRASIDRARLDLDLLELTPT